jgi:hypothetical protein
MSSVEIFYVKNQKVTQPLIREIDIEKQDPQRYSYQMCPVWNHKAKRTFVASSPIDYSFTVDVENKNVIYHDDTFLDNDRCENMFLTMDDLTSPHPIIQVTVPSYFFWCKEPNVWLEYKDHPFTAAYNNFISIGGWFNLSNHPKDSSVGMKILDETKPVIVRKNDPVYKLCFHPVDLSSEIELIEVDSIPSDIQDLVDLNQQKKSKRDKSFFTEILFPSR